MEPNRVGRILGIGTRVVASKLRDGTAGAAAAVERGRASGAAEAVRGAGVASGSADVTEGSRRLARGAGRFSAALWKPFAHATGMLTLQITGLLFAFFALGFGAKSWQLYRESGWRDHHLPLYAGFGMLFLWFAVSSFWRAGQKRRRQP
jgi:hypothetical protein